MERDRGVRPNMNKGRWGKVTDKIENSDITKRPKSVLGRWKKGMTKKEPVVSLSYRLHECIPLFKTVV